MLDENDTSGVAPRLMAKTKNNEAPTSPSNLRPSSGHPSVGKEREDLSIRQELVKDATEACHGQTGLIGLKGNHAFYCLRLLRSVFETQ